MPNEELPEGASFLDVLDTPEAEGDKPTPAKEEEGTPAATEGGKTPESEELGVLKETPAKTEDEEDKPDLELDPDLEKHPVLKAKWEAYKAQKEKGINKFIEGHNAKLAEVEERYEPVKAFFDQFENPATVDQAFREACVGLAKTYGRPFGGYDAQGNQVQSEAATSNTEVDGESKSKYGFEFASDDKIADVVLAAVRSELKEIKEAFGPISKKFETDAQAEAFKAKAAEATPHLKSTYETAAAPWVTAEMVEAAIREFPTLEPATAFKAKYADEIAKYAAKHAGATKVRDLPNGEAGGKTRSELSAGADMLSIFQSEATL